MFSSLGTLVTRLIIRQIGNGQPPRADVAVDPVEGTTLLASGLRNAVSVVALSERDTMYSPPGIFYMAVGPDGRGVCSLEMSVADKA